MLTKRIKLGARFSCRQWSIAWWKCESLSCISCQNAPNICLKWYLPQYHHRNALAPKQEAGERLLSFACTRGANNEGLYQRYHLGYVGKQTLNLLAGRSSSSCVGSSVILSRGWTDSEESVVEGSRTVIDIKLFLRSALIISLSTNAFSNSLIRFARSASTWKTNNSCPRLKISGGDGGCLSSFSNVDVPATNRQLHLHAASKLNRWESAEPHSETTSPFPVADRQPALRLRAICLSTHLRTIQGKVITSKGRVPLGCLMANQSYIRV